MKDSRSGGSRNIEGGSDGGGGGGGGGGGVIGIDANSDHYHTSSGPKRSAAFADLQSIPLQLAARIPICIN